MKNLVIFFVVFSLSFVFNSCQEEIFEQEIETSEIVIKMSLPEDEADTDGLKSADVSQEIKSGDTITIKDCKLMNVLFSAYNKQGQSIEGKWESFLIDCDNDADNQRLANRLFKNNEGPISSLKPTELGLYQIHFRVSGTNEVFFFYLKRVGVPGQVGDSWENNYAFRMEKKIVHDHNDGGESKEAFTLYLKAEADEFKAWGESGGINPNNKDYWKALLFCGGQNFFTSKGDITYNAKSFKLRVAKYAEPGYLAFTFFPEDTPPVNFYGGGKTYSVQFYAGEYGQDWWTFKSNYESDWTIGMSSQIQFLMF